MHEQRSSLHEVYEHTACVRMLVCLRWDSEMSPSIWTGTILQR